MENYSLWNWQSLAYAVAVVLVVWFFARRLFRRKRINPLLALSKKLSLSVQEDHDDILEHELRDFPLSGLGKVFPKLFFVF